MAEQNDVCRQCHALLVELKSEMGHINRNMMKLVYAMLGIISGQLGAEFFKKQFAPTVAHAATGGNVMQTTVDIPWYLTSGVYVVIGSGVFVILNLWAARKNIHTMEKVVYILLLALLFYGSGLRIYFYSIGERIPQIYGIISNLLYILTSLSISVRAWTLSDLPFRWFGKERRRCVREDYACSIDRKAA